MKTDTAFEEVCRRLGIAVPEPSKPVGSYRPVVLSGGFAFLSGQISRGADGKPVTGRIGEGLSLDEGKRAAQLALIQAVSLVRREFGLERVEQVVRMTGYLQAAAGFSAHSDVMNAADRKSVV